jgi:hypothetical protein
LSAPRSPPPTVNHPSLVATKDYGQGITSRWPYVMVYHTGVCDEPQDELQLACNYVKHLGRGRSTRPNVPSSPHIRAHLGQAPSNSQPAAPTPTSWIRQTASYILLPDVLLPATGNSTRRTSSTSRLDPVLDVMLQTHSSHAAEGRSPPPVRCTILKKCS